MEENLAYALSKLFSVVEILALVYVGTTVASIAWHTQRYKVASKFITKTTIKFPEDLETN